MLLNAILLNITSAYAANTAATIKVSQLNFETFKTADFLSYAPLSDTPQNNSQQSNTQLNNSPLKHQQIIALPSEHYLSISQRKNSQDLGEPALYRLLFDNDTDFNKALILQLDNPMIDTIEWLLVIDGNIIKQELMGDFNHQPFVLKSSLPHFNFEIPANTKASVFLQLTSQGTTIAPLRLHDESGFKTTIYQSFLTWGAFIGIILMMIAYNSLLYLGIRNKIYLFYVGYIIAMAIQLGTVYGYGFHLLPFSLQSLLQAKIVSINYVISVFAILFALHFLRYDKQRGSLFRYSNYFCSLLAGLGVVTLFIPEYIAAKIYYPLQIATYLLIARLCIPKLFDGLRWTNYYLISWIPLFIGTTVAQLVLLNIVPYNYFTNHVLLFGVVAEIAIISFALAERFRSKENERIYNVTHDSVTNLPNKVLLTECTAVQMDEQKSFTLIMFRAEKFSEIKPALGLIAANNLVTAIVDNVADYFSAMDNLYVFEKDNRNDIRLSRINDDTFGLLLMGEHAEDELSYIILTIQEAVSTPINVGGYSVSTSCAVGSVSYPQYGINAEMVLQKAMHSLDMATNETGRFAFYSNDNNVDIQEQLQMVADLQKAIDDDLLEIYHQVQIDLASQTVCGNEALVRWNHPTRGFISPEVFVSLAESTGMISQLTEWVIERSLEQHKELLDWGFRQNISINLSAKDLTQSGLIAHIMTTIADLDLDPSTIIFELTESATSDDPVHALQTINQLHELNLKVAIDDFGTGYSSLEYLSKLPFHELKVDKSFVLDILEQKRDQAITKTTIEMAKNLGIFVVAEGIESAEIEAMLKSFGCEIGQGYFYSKPLPLEAYKQWLQQSQYAPNNNTPTDDSSYSDTLKMAQ